MYSLKIICGGIGFLVFSICCFLMANMAEWYFMTVPTLFALLIGIIMVIVGLFINEKN